mmetsp:Transcript_52621/g.104441  ORF Transcript_52621/g.104441 Transcript_52621/m.104441 type:complete len:307 (-) Transcript_52621:41-961(-)
MQLRWGRAATTLAVALLGSGKCLALGIAVGANVEASAASVRKRAYHKGSTHFWPFDLGESDSLASDGDLPALTNADSSTDEALPMPAPRAPLLRQQGHQMQKLQLLRKASQGSVSQSSVRVSNPDAPLSTKAWIPDALQQHAQLPQKKVTGDGSIASVPHGDAAVDEFDLPDGMVADAATLGAKRVVLASQQRRQSLAMVKQSPPPAAPVPQDPSIRMREQCMTFAGWVKKQGVYGRDLVALFKSTCDPAVRTGAASAKYAQMCDTLGGDIQGFADNPEWTPALACRALLRIWSYSGIGKPVQRNR